MAGKPLLPKIEALEARIAALEKQAATTPGNLWAIQGTPLAQAIAANEKVYRQYRALARRLQGTTKGFLTDLVETMRGTVDHSVKEAAHD